MIGIDTNVLVRFITNDDQVLHNKADQFLTTGISSSNRGFVNLVVLCELVWTVKFRYKASRPEISDIISFLLETDVLVVEKHALVLKALSLFKVSNADFSDCLIGELNRAAGCEHTATFDKVASKLEGFELLC